MSPVLSPSFFYTHTPPPEIYTLSLHDALPISTRPESNEANDALALGNQNRARRHHLPAEEAQVLLGAVQARKRSEEHTSELQSRRDLVCRLLLEKKKKKKNIKG